MPKMKSRKALTKRFKVTATGQLKRSHGGKRHLLTKKTAKRKRHLSRPCLVSTTQLKTYKRLMCV